MNKAFVVTRNSIPAIHTVEQAGVQHSLGELRDFRWHSQLERFMASASELSISWVALRQGEVLEPHVHPIQSMMIFYRGSGEMLGQKPRPIGRGDIVVVPPGCEHGFVGGADGLYALSIQFGNGLYTVPHKPQVVFSESESLFEQLLAHNKTRLAEFENKRFFKLLQGGILKDPNKRRMFLDALQVWTDGNQALLFARQATCRDPFWEPIFLKHLHEKTGHDKPLDDALPDDPNSKTSPVRDPTLEAITGWFAYQMQILDNLEKAAIQFVVENANTLCHRMVKSHITQYADKEYFDAHIKSVDGYASLGKALLKNQNHRTYARLRAIMDEAWDMLSAMTDRVVDMALAA